MSSSQRVIRQFVTQSLSIGLILAFLAATNLMAQSTDPRSRLAQIHWPEVTKLEREVRDHLVDIQKTLTAAINNKSVTQAALAENYGDAGRTYHAYSLLLPARECYSNASLLAPKDFRWPYLIAKIDQQEGRFDDAIQHFGKAGALNPGYAAIDVNLGNIFLEQNQPEKADASFRKALVLEPKNAAVFYGLGQLALAQRRYADAVSNFEQALAQVPGANRIHYSLGLAYRGAGDLARAESHLAQRGTVGVRVTDPIFDQLTELVAGERLHLIRGRTALEAQRFADAAAEFRKAIAAKPDSAAAHLNLGTTLVQLNDLDGAVAELKTALRIEPENTTALFNLAFVLSTQEKHLEAVGELQTLLKIVPNDSSARFFLAKELLKLQRRAEALTEFLRFSQADPANEEAVLQAATLLVQSRQYANALSLLEESHRQFPQKGETAATLAYVLAASPQYSLRAGARALDLAQKVFQASGLAQHGAIGSLALAELGRCAEAADWQRKMIALAEKQQQTDLATRLKSDLNLYEGKQSCRPAGQ